MTNARSFAAANLMRAAAIVLVAAMCACGSKTKPVDSAAEPAGDLTIKPAPDALVVAQVNGQPVYGDCVAIQVEHGRANTAKQALQQCIDFELLAQEAMARGYLSGTKMIDLRKQEATRAFMDADFAAKFSTPADVPEDDLKQWYNRAKGRYVHPELRKVFYVRAPYTKDTPAGTPEDHQARVFANELYDGLKGEFFFGWKLPKHNLNKDSFTFLARRTANGQPLVVGEKSHTFKRWGPVHETFRKPSFALKRVGDISPPSRTPWGWDIILLEHITLAKNVTFDEAKADLSTLLFQVSRGKAFLRWAEQFVAVKSINMTIQQQSLNVLRQMQAAEDQRNLPTPTTAP